MGRSFLLQTLEWACPSHQVEVTQILGELGSTTPFTFSDHHQQEDWLGHHQEHYWLGHHQEHSSWRRWGVVVLLFWANPQIVVASLVVAVLASLVTVEVAASLARHFFTSIYLQRVSFTRALFKPNMSYTLVTFIINIKIGTKFGKLNTRSTISFRGYFFSFWVPNSH